MNTDTYISDLGFTSTEAFLHWQLTRYLLERSVTLQAKIQVFKHKYKTDFASFEAEIENSNHELPGVWEDSILWEALEIDLQQVHDILAQMEIEEIAFYSEAEVKISTETEF